MQLSELYKKALAFEFLTVEEGMYLFEHAPLTELMNVADELRKLQVPHGKVSWQKNLFVADTLVVHVDIKID